MHRLKSFYCEGRVLCFLFVLMVQMTLHKMFEINLTSYADADRKVFRADQLLTWACGLFHKETAFSSIPLLMVLSYFNEQRTFSRTQTNINPYIKLYCPQPGNLSLAKYYSIATEKTRQQYN